MLGCILGRACGFEMKHVCCLGCCNVDRYHFFLGFNFPMEHQQHGDGNIDHYKDWINPFTVLNR